MDPLGRPRRCCGLSTTRFACAHCDAAFTDEDYWALHVGRRHPEASDAVAQKLLRAAEAREAEALLLVRRHVRAGFATLPVFLLFVFVAILLVSFDGNPAWIVMVSPGFAAFGALLYAMTYSHQASREGGMPPRGPGP